MTTFALIGALLAVLALALLTRPLWRKPRPARNQVDAAAIGSLGQQLEQLTALHRAGTLAEAQYLEARQALEKRIVEAVVKAPAAPAAAAPRPASKLLPLGIAGFVVAVAVAGYALLGTPQALDPAAVAAAAAPAGEGHSVTAAQIEGMIEKLATRLKENPADADGWAMLGRSYAVLGRHEQALPALKKAVELRGNDAMLLVDYADALAVNNGRSLEGEPTRLIEKALAADPNNVKALALAGTVAFNRKDFAGALRHWEKVPQVAPGSDWAQQIQGGIDEARRLMGGGTAAATAAPQTQAAAPAATAAPVLPGSSITGTVTLAAALAAKASPEDTLFVFARAAEGPRMPLAILRKQVKDLPLSFTLDDSMAMTPAARLSTAGRVVVGARISKRGDATPQPGDLQALSAPVAPGAAGLKIEIAEVVGP